MENIDPIAESNFFVGTLGLLLKLKLSIYEKNQEDTKMVLKNMEKCKKHLTLLKNFSPLAAFYIIFYTTFYEFLDSNNNKEIMSDQKVFELFNTFEEFLINRKFNKK